MPISNIMKNYSKTPIHKKVIKSDDADSNVWALPSVEQEVNESEQVTNALNKKPTWRYEPPEEPEEEVAPLTAEDIEQIRQAAYEEGFNQGKEEGFATGFEQGQKAGHEEGVKTGHEEGINQGLAEGQTQVTALAEQWQQLVDQLHHPLKVVENNIEQQLIQLTVQLTEAITHHEVSVNHDILLSAINAGIKALPSQEAQTHILLHPDDIKVVEQHFSADDIQQQGWRLLPAPHLTPGSCQIENSTSNIDLSMKTRIREVLESFLQEALHQK